VEVRQGDVFLGLELSLGRIVKSEDYIKELRNRGVKIVFVMYDLLPVLHPEWFLDDMGPAFKRWLDIVTRTAAGIVCISKTVANELNEWLDRERPNRVGPLQIGHFQLGSDIERSVPTSGIPEGAVDVLQALNARASFLMVGTVEPRKGH